MCSIFDCSCEVECVGMWPKPQCVVVNEDFSDSFAGNLMTPWYERFADTVAEGLIVACGLLRSAGNCADQCFRSSLGVRAESACAIDMLGRV